MAGKTYVTKGYSTYTDIPARQGGYDHGTEKPRLIHTPAAGFTELVGSPSKIELLKEYVHSPRMSSNPKYASPDHYEGHDPTHGLNYENSSPPNYHGRDAFKKAHNEASLPMKTSNFSSPNKYRPSSPVHGYPSEETRPGLEVARHVRTGNFSGPNKSWQSVGPPPTRHPLTTPTNNINEALGFLEESVNHFAHSDPRRRGVLDDLSTRAQPIEPQSRYARPAFGVKPKDTRHDFTNRGTTIDSHQAARRYRGTLMP